MSVKTLKPILINFDGTNKKLAYLIFAKDGSIYIEFPRKRGYLVTAVESVPFESKDKKGEIVLRLPRKNLPYKDPSISYHPGSRTPGRHVLHSNTRNKEIFRKDTTVLMMGENAIFFPLCQIVVSSPINYLDVFGSKKYLPPVQINCHNPERITGLSINIFIHDCNYFLDPEDVPFKKKWLETHKNMQLVKVSPPDDFPFACTLMLNEFRDPPKASGLIILVSNDERPFVYNLEPL